MFTGIIEEIGTIKAIKREKHSLVLTISATRITEDVKTGDSINTNGVCLTVTSFTTGTITVDVMPETFRKSNLSKLQTGDKVNLERALKFSDRLGGHLVSGHIDCGGQIVKKWKEENAVWLTVEIPAEMRKYIVEKGSVSLDGISLTVARVDERSLDVSIIPHTQQITTLLEKQPGSIVNIECDLIAKYLEKLVAGDQGKITADYLQKLGY